MLRACLLLFGAFAMQGALGADTVAGSVTVASRFHEWSTEIHINNTKRGENVTMYRLGAPLKLNTSSLIFLAPTNFPLQPPLLLNLTVYRKKREADDDVPWAAAETCELTPEELSDLGNVLKSAIEQIRGKLSASSLQKKPISLPSQPTVSSSDCRELVRYIKSVTENVVSEASLLGQHAASGDKLQLEAALRKLEDKEAKFIRATDLIKKQHNEKLQLETGKFIDEINKLNLQYTEALGKIQALEAKTIQLAKKAIISDLKNDDSTSAVETYKGIQDADGRELEQIISASKVKNIAAVLLFINQLRYLPHVVDAQSKLYDTLKRNNELLDSGIFSFLIQVALTLEQPNFPNLSPSMQAKARTTFLNADNKADEFAKIWGTRVGRGDYSGILDAFNNPDVYFSIKVHTPKIIQTAFSSRGNVEVLDQILPFLRSLKVGIPMLDSIEALLSVLNRNGKIYTRKALELIYLIELLRHNGGTENEQFRRVVASVPSEMAFFLGKPTCTVYNVEHGGYMLAESLFDSERRYVFTRNPGHILRNALWKFEAVDNGKMFRILNTFDSEYLFAGGKTYDSERRYAFTWENGKPVNQGNWIITPSSDGRHFWIQNKANNNEYLFASGFTYSSGKHYVFTWIPGSQDSDSRWSLDCKPDSHFQ